MLIGYMGIARLIIQVQQFEEDKLKDREEFKNKTAKTSGNKSRQQKSNVDRSSFQHKQKGHAPSSTSAPTPRNKCEYNSQNSQKFRAKPVHSQGTMAQGDTKTPACAKVLREEEEEEKRGERRRKFKTHQDRRELLEDFIKGDPCANHDSISAKLLNLKIVMPLRRAVRGRPTRRNVEEQGVCNALEGQPHR
uniref:Gag-pol polyprotein n=1 Tax=Solanum tuberosum TaxID=4113 RepID=M1D8G3_SOLTU